MLAAAGAFRVVPERGPDSRDNALDCRNDSLEHLIEEGLVRTISLDGHDRGVTLTDRGRDLLCDSSGNRLAFTSGTPVQTARPAPAPD
jgi:hypothetical protein